MANRGIRIEKIREIIRLGTEHHFSHRVNRRIYLRLFNFAYVTIGITCKIGSHRRKSGFVTA